MRALGTVALSLVIVAFGLSAESLTPEQVVEVAATGMQQKLQGKQEYYAENLDELYAVIDEVLLPHFDVRFAGRMVLGKHWRPATDEQRERFIDLFYTFLLHTYSKGMLEFEQDGLHILPPAETDRERRAIVMTELQLDDGTVVPVNYSLRNTSVGWKVYDVRIEGISYVQNYRSQFNAEISARGIEAVIARLEGGSKATADTDGEGST